MVETSAAASGAAAPVVSVIISTFNSRGYLAEAMDALAGQTLNPEQLEILIVDDGSTDGTWEYLTGLAADRPNLRIYCQPNSGNPSRGRNRGLGEAAGRYVFFHDADDYLGADALRRLTETAENEASDIVVGHMHRIGRPTALRPTDVTELDADLVRDAVWRSLSACRLIRRSLIERLNARFPEDMVAGEDQVFMAGCLFGAHKISMLGGYGFYYRRTREDGGNLSSKVQTLTNKMLTSCRVTAVVVANTEPGRRRDALLRRIMLHTLPSGMNVIYMTASPSERERFLAAVKSYVLPHLSPRLLRRAEPATRFRLLTAKYGSADQLVALNKVLAKPWRYQVDEGRVTYDLDPDLNALIDAPRRAVRGKFTLQPRIVAIAPIPNGLSLRVAVQQTGLPIDRLHLETKLRGTQWLDLGGVQFGADCEATLAIRPAALVAEGADADEDQRWLLRLVGRGGGIVLAKGLLGWPVPDDHLPPAYRRVTLRGRPHLRAKVYRDAAGRARLNIRRVKPTRQRSRLRSAGR